ncbi:hypothetical conserved protein [Candidatus Nitrosoglobus terrae]|uniref:Purine nucleoside phosphorylase n=1 Tax=Candidatus Nitrosoglobus terrae TaxID=1630141 RepID=A0A1Q2SPD0_9GAMM|nr:peptidoglycan editing factor PgeF [Candidatus Nitrosoglobus terrae]BAW80963.1 hypothetical conserved protein [Candidatus Nitrosoglobus terrae]
MLKNNINESSNSPLVITPCWPAPSNIRAYTTTRNGGVSCPPYDSFNLADHVGDRTDKVQENRKILAKSLALPSEPVWLEQVHGNNIIDAAHGIGQGDASIAHKPDIVCGVLTADCLPLLLCNQQGTRVAAVHAGWRGLAAGIIERIIKALDISSEHLLAWMGPAIGPTAFEVGSEVKQIFIHQDSRNTVAFSALSPLSQGRWLADIYQLARLALTKLGIRYIYGGHYCTMTESKRFYSYRRDGETGRMATLIWLANSY